VLGNRTQVCSVMDDLARVIARIHQARGIVIDAECDDRLFFRGERQDLEEMLGNLLDNASKWARTKVILAAASLSPAGNGAGNWLEIRVDDDGPGLTEEQMADPIIRGRRLDETKPGSGLGHSIVADLAHSYSGKLELARSEHGGLSAKLTLPLAA